MEYGQNNAPPFFFYTSFGVELNFLDFHSNTFDFYENPEEVEDITFVGRGRDTSKPHHILINMGAGVGYQLNERFNLSLEPSFKVGVGNPFANFKRVRRVLASTSYNFAWGIRAMLTYRLTERKKK